MFAGARAAALPGYLRLCCFATNRRDKSGGPGIAWRCGPFNDHQSLPLWGGSFARGMGPDKVWQTWDQSEGNAERTKEPRSPAKLRGSFLRFSPRRNFALRCGSFSNLNKFSSKIGAAARASLLRRARRGAAASRQWARQRLAWQEELTTKPEVARQHTTIMTYILL